MHDDPNPSGLCQCGCGRTTTVASRTYSKRGWFKGKHHRFIRGHNGRITVDPDVVGYCGCGCGLQTNLAPFTDARVGWVKGQPLRFVRGHASAKTPVGLIDYIVDSESECWLWQRAIDRDGYGRRHAKPAHRYIYERERGPIPDGLQLDHLCRTPRCVNPDHLEPVTAAENRRRADLARKLGT